MTEEQALVRAKRGDAGAFEALVTPYEAMIWRVCCRMLPQQEDARDALQDTMFRAWRAVAGFRGDSSVSTWLYRIAVSCCLDMLRRQKSRPASSLESMMEENGYDPPAADPPPDAVLEAREDKETVRLAIQALPDEQRVPLLLSCVEGRSYEEIALLLSLPVGTVKSRIARARIHLVKILKESGNFSGPPASKHDERRASP